jgi:hypothetical protein
MRAETTFDRRVTKDDFNEMPVLVPPLTVQRAICRFLDGEADRLRRLTTMLSRAAELMKERTQGVLDREIGSGTQGGIRLRLLADLVRDSADHGPRHRVSLEHIEAFTGRVTRLPHGPRPEGGFVAAAQGDVLFGKLRPYLRKVWLVGSEGSKMPRTDWEKLGEARLVVPGRGEQRDVASRLVRAFARHADLTQHTTKQIELLQERFDAAVAAVVTGRIAISQAAA